MSQLSAVSQVVGYGLIAIMAFYMLLLTLWQLKVLSGRSMQNPDGSTDDWKVQKTHYGMAFADLFVAAPATVLGIALVFVAPRWGLFTLSLIAFWFVWTNTMTTATSLRFEKPEITLEWLIVFPSGIAVGAAWMIWTIIHSRPLLGW